jgi:hypothetical protein
MLFFQISFAADHLILMLLLIILTAKFPNRLVAQRQSVRVVIYYSTASSNNFLPQSHCEEQKRVLDEDV